MRVYGNQKMLSLLSLGVASGLPLFLAGKTLQAWLTVSKVDLGLIGAFSLVNLPFSFKFLWAPLLDRYRLPFLGRRRGWLLVFQGLLFAGIVALSWVGLGGLEGSVNLVEGSWWSEIVQKFALLYRSPFFWLVLFITFCSASQDVVVDAYRTEVLTEGEMGAGAAIFVLGYRFALLITGGWAFILADRLGWPIAYGLIAPIMTIGMVTTFFAPAESDFVPVNLKQAIVEPFLDFMQRPRWGVIFAFVVLYKIGDALVNNMSTTFLLQLGFSLTELGTIQGGFGLISTIIGALMGGSVISRIGISRSLWVFGILQAMSNFSYVALATIGNNGVLLFGAINLENFCGGLGTSAFTAFLMSLCNPKFSGTQYALLSSLFAFSRDILISPSGELVKSIGWENFFLLSVVISLPGLMLLPFFAPWNSDRG